MKGETMENGMQTNPVEADDADGSWEHRGDRVGRSAHHIGSRTARARLFGLGSPPRQSDELTHWAVDEKNRPELLR